MKLLYFKTKDDENAFDTDIFSALYALERDFEKGRTKKQIEHGFYVSMINPNFLHNKNVCFMLLYRDRKNISGQKFKSVVFEYQKECFNEEVEIGFKKRLDFINSHDSLEEALTFARALYGIQTQEDLKDKINDFNDNKEIYIREYNDEVLKLLDEGKRRIREEKQK